MFLNICLNVSFKYVLITSWYNLLFVLLNFVNRPPCVSGRIVSSFGALPLPGNTDTTIPFSAGRIWAAAIFRRNDGNYVFPEALQNLRMSKKQPRLKLIHRALSPLRTISDIACLMTLIVSYNNKIFVFVTHKLNFHGSKQEHQFRIYCFRWFFC